MNKRLLIGLGLLLFVLYGSNSYPAQAKEISYHGISLSPAVQNIEISPSQASKSFKIRVENRQDNTVTLIASSLDFKSLNDSGGVAFIGSNAGNLEHKYGLANWIILPNGPFTLKAKSSQEVTVTIDNRADLSPGGHYASVLFKDNTTQRPGVNKVSFNQVIASLVFLKKTGGEVYSLNLAQPNIKTSWLTLPSSIPLFITNSGNTQTAPRGVITISSSGDKEYSRGIINSDSALVLPDSRRFFRVPLISTGHAWLPGKYKATVTLRPDDTETAQTKEYEFFYVNLISLAILGGIIAFLYYVRMRISRIRNRRKRRTRRH